MPVGHVPRNILSPETNLSSLGTLTAIFSMRFWLTMFFWGKAAPTPTVQNKDSLVQWVVLKQGDNFYCSTWLTLFSMVSVDCSQCTVLQCRCCSLYYSAHTVHCTTQCLLTTTNANWISFSCFSCSHCSNNAPYLPALSSVCLGWDTLP